MDKDLQYLTSWAKENGFIFQSSSIYGGFSGVYDYGPMGVLLVNNIKNLWWKDMVQKMENVVGLDSGIIMDPKVWEASGHTKNFNDPYVFCKESGEKYRADHLLQEIGIKVDEKTPKDEFLKLFEKNKDKIKACGHGDLSEVIFFNLLVKSNLGDFTESNKNPTYLRGETCQGIYVNYKNVLDSSNVKIPFGIAQIGKAFRNEISARQFIFRTREFEQMEMQYFTKGEDKKKFEELKKYRLESLINLGISKKNLREKKHDNLVFYAKDAYDIEYKYPFGWAELEGIHNRGDYDLTQHQEYSKTKLEYYDQEANEKFIPNILETSIGVGRLFLAVINDALVEDEVDGEKRTVLKLKKELAPIKIAVLPLQKKEEFIKKSKEVFDLLKNDFMCTYDESKTIGRRYRRQDEIGTPFCITIDFDSLKDNQVTVRDRDTTKQTRIPIKELEQYFKENLN